MNAKEAKSLVKSAENTGTYDVEREIKQLAQDGYSELNYYKTLNHFQIQALRDKGFDVSGPYGGANGSRLWIEW